jgi:hypothetical protein
MAMRLRLMGGVVTALCAAASAPMPGDRYLDDAEDSAIRRKLELDFASEGLYSGPVDEDARARIAIAEKEGGRDGQG